MRSSIHQGFTEAEDGIRFLLRTRELGWVDLPPPHTQKSVNCGGAPGMAE